MWVMIGVFQHMYCGRTFVAFGGWLTIRGYGSIVERIGFAEWVTIYAAVGLMVWAGGLIRLI